MSIRNDYSLKGRNEKTRWLQTWRKLPEQQWQSGALRSGLLLSAFENYKKANYEDLNHFYSGINALGLLTVSQLSQEATARQLKIYEQLHVASKNVKAVLNELPDVRETVKKEQQHYLLFTGHMIDKPERKEPRFPAHKEKAVRQKMKEEIEKVKNKTKGQITGIAGGACGGDILFHEICEELEIPTELYLALPREIFLVESVAFAGAQWIDRFDHLYKRLPVYVLSQSKELPRWLQKKQNYSIWERNNLWELNCALTEGVLNMTLIVLWDGKGGDGPGGTAGMVKEAKAKGARCIIINPEDR